MRTHEKKIIFIYFHMFDKPAQPSLGTKHCNSVARSLTVAPVLLEVKLSNDQICRSVG